jgi:hypothetical protein
MSKGIPQLVHAAICFSILCIASPTLLPDQSGCSAQDFRNQFPPSDHAYMDAMNFARNLAERGFAVQCILGSKWRDIFEGQEGAAYYRTVHGDFDVLFLPKPESWAALKIMEDRKKNGSIYAYLFRGTPHIIGTAIYGPGISYFIKHGKALVFAWRNKQLAASLDAALTNSRTW